MPVTNYRELIAWQKAMELVVATYRISRMLPKEELYGLTAQVRRAAVSIPSNIAEGQGRQSTKEFLHHLSYAYGSMCEVETQLVLMQKLDYVDQATIAPVLASAGEVGRLINGLSRALEKTTKPQLTDH